MISTSRQNLLIAVILMAFTLSAWNASAGEEQPPFPRPPVRPNGSFRGLRPKSKLLAAWQPKKGKAAAASLEITVEADADHPIVNPAFVVKNWGNGGAALTPDGKPIPRGKDFRFGHRQTLEGTDLVVWLKFESDKLANISIQPNSSSPL